MKTLGVFTILLSVLFSPITLKGQNQTNKELIKRIYDVLQQSNDQSNDLVALTPGIKWNEIQEGDDSHHILIKAVMNKRWGRVFFDQLIIKENGKEQVLVSGFMNGREPTECDYISTPFQHFWSIKEGQVIKFSE